MRNEASIALHKATKAVLDKRKLCNEESYNAVIVRLLKMTEAQPNA